MIEAIESLALDGITGGTSATFLVLNMPAGIALLAGQEPPKVEQAPILLASGDGV